MRRIFNLTVLFLICVWVGYTFGSCASRGSFHAHAQTDMHHAHTEDDLRIMSIRVKALTATGITYERFTVQEVGELQYPAGVFIPEKDHKACVGCIKVGASAMVVYCHFCHTLIAYNECTQEACQ